MTLLIVLLSLFLALPCYAQQLNPGGGIISGGTPNLNAVFAPGPVSITGNSQNGSDQITGIANVNGVMYANNFSGVDIGAKVNNAIGALGAAGGMVMIQPGNYSFSTTIQCPLAANAPVVIIQGSGETWAAPNTGTVLTYTGSGDAINDFNSNAGLANNTGCKIRDLTLTGPGSTTSAIGFHFGGVAYAETRDVMIQNFGNGIKVHNASGLWTERYVIEQTGFNHNGTAMYFHCDAGCDTSAGHGLIQADLNLIDGQYGIRTDGGIWIYATNAQLDGNAAPTTANATLISTTTNLDMVSGGVWTENVECNSSGSGHCIRFNLAAGTVMAGAFWDFGAGSWSDSGTGVQNLLQTAMFNTVSVANGAHVPILNNPGLGGIIPACGGIFTVSTASNGDTGAYLCGATFCGLILESWPGGYWVPSTTTPAAGKSSVAWDSADTANAIYNNTGVSQTYTVATTCSKRGG